MKRFILLSIMTCVISLMFTSNDALAFFIQPQSLPYVYNGHTYNHAFAQKISESFTMIQYCESESYDVAYRSSDGAIAAFCGGANEDYSNIGYEHPANYALVMCFNADCTSNYTNFTSGGPAMMGYNFVSTPLSDNIYSSVNVVDSSMHNVVMNANLTTPHQLTVNLNPAGGGSVTSDPGSLTCLGNACTGSFSGNISVTASTNSGYQFVNWLENGTVITNNCPATTLNLTMNTARTVSAEFMPVLKWPLTGAKSSRNEGWTFGSTWTRGECPTGTYKKHAGIDVNATYGEEIYAAHDGVVKKIYTGQHSLWADAIVIENTDGRFTTVYWHLNKYGNLAENDTVTKGEKIATVANLPDDNTHFHFGVRFSAFSDPESYAGALPVAGCGGYLAYPEKFLDPDSLTYE